MNEKTVVSCEVLFLVSSIRNCSESCNQNIITVIITILKKSKKLFAAQKLNISNLGEN